MTLNSCKLSTDSFLGFHSRRSNSNTRRDVIDPKMILVFFRFRHEPFVKLNIILCALHFTKQRHAMQLMARVQEREIITFFASSSSFSTLICPGYLCADSGRVNVRFFLLSSFIFLCLLATALWNGDVQLRLAFEWGKFAYYPMCARTSFTFHLAVFFFFLFLR